MQSAKLFFAVFFASMAIIANAIIPIPCANVASLTARECCPVPPNLPNAGQCGASLQEPRGRCQPIKIPESEYNSTEKDVRKKWPIQYFNSTCVCNERFGGFDCGDCSYGYNDGGDCKKKTIHQRRSVSSMNEEDWKRYHTYLKNIKETQSRYMVAKSESSNVQELMISLVQPTTYDLFVWIHHFVAKDNEITLGTDYFTDFAHEGTGFPTWHRLFLLWLIQIQNNDHTFRLPYWDWSDPFQREILFTNETLGQNVNGEVVGSLFNDWKTYCWENREDNTTGYMYPIPICDPTVSSNETLRRCPNDTLCNESNSNWPSKTDVEHAISIKTYDTEPYNRSVKGDDTSFRSFMEGFIVKSDCRDDTLCSSKDQPPVTRKLHNTVHIILGLGDIKHAPKNFEEQGVMSCVAASPNDPIFINHHAKIDFILEEWLEKNKGMLSYPQTDDIREGHRRNDYIVPIIPLFTHEDMFKTADNFGYKYSATEDETSDEPTTGSMTTSKGTSQGVSHTTLIALIPTVMVALLVLGV